MKPQAYSQFMSRFFPTFLLGFFSAVFGLSIAVALWSDLQWRNPSDNAQYSTLLGAGLALLLSLGHFVMIRGRRWGLGVIWAVLGIGLLMGMSLLGSRMPAVLVGASLLLLLVSLLVLNSSRHREMRAYLIALAIERRGS
ncbi:hypothetical protein [Pseudomonas cremoricolorata]|uniref:hypothetical protein n=1 Tax=Pseudomonas cremoricolorata TaxID=157783 RepID=UPI0004126CA6|nr:hypothetical protein [Pseudomonas cremoricolorata]